MSGDRWANIYRVVVVLGLVLFVALAVVVYTGSPFGAALAGFGALVILAGFLADRMVKDVDPVEPEH